MESKMQITHGKRQDVINALEHREVWPVPYYITGDALMIRRLLERFQVSSFDEYADNYIVWPQAYPNVPADLEGDTYTDQWGITWTDVGVARGFVLHHPLKEPTIQGHHFPESLPDACIEPLRRVRRQHADRFLLAKLGDLFERARYLRGMEGLMLDMYDHPEFVDALFERITAYNIAVIERLADEEIGIDGLSLSDDYGSQNSLLMSPKMWRRFVKPHLKAVFESMHRRGFRAFLHSDGDVTPLVPELIELGVEVLHPIQPESMDMLYIKREYGSALTLFGGVGTQQTLPRSSPDEIQAEVWRICKTLGRGGGFILAPGIGLNHDVPLENAIAFIEAAMNQSPA